MKLFRFHVIFYFCRSALHIAAATGHAKALVVLLQCGLPVNIDITDNDGKTPLFKVFEFTILIGFI